MVTKAITKKEDIETLKEYFLKEGKVRDYALFAMGINLGINVSRLISLRWRDVYDAQSKGFVSFIKNKDKSNGKERQVALNENCKTALTKLLDTRTEPPSPETFIFESKNGGPITRFRVFQIIKSASEHCGIEGNIGCQSMRKTLDHYAYTVLPEL